MKTVIPLTPLGQKAGLRPIASVFFIPNLSKQVDRRWRKARIVVVRKQKEVTKLSVFYERTRQTDPLFDVWRAVHNRPVPGSRHRFDSLAVSKPTDIREVCSNQVQWFLELPRSRHERRIGKSQSDVSCPEKIGQPGIEP